jgi:hypothetical protein
MRAVLFILFLVVTFAITHAQTLRIELPEGLALADNRSTVTRSPLEIECDLASRRGWAWSPTLPGREHRVRVLTAEPLAGGGWKLDLEVLVGPHRNRPLTTGGRIRAAIDLAVDSGAGLRGRHRSTPEPADTATLDALERAWGYGPVPNFKDTETHRLLRQRDFRLADAPWEGAAIGTLETASPAGPPPVTPHPRLLFTASDLPAIRAVTEGERGAGTLRTLRELLERADRHGFSYHAPGAEHSMGNQWAAGHAFLYQLTGNRAHAARAEELSRANLFGNYYYGGGWLHPYTLIGLAYAYDWSGNAWQPEFRAMVYSYLWKNARQLALFDDSEDPLRVADRYRFANDQAAFAIRSPADPTGAQFRAAAAIGALAILGDAPPAYAPPPLADVPRLAPATNYEPPPGVPVLPFESDIMPREWLINGPFLRAGADKELAALGGLAAARPIPGDAVISDGETVEFRHYRPNGANNPAGGAIYARVCGRSWASSTGGGYGPGIRLVRRWKSENDQAPAINVSLYTVIDNDRERVVQALPNWRSASCGNRMWLNGRELKDGDLVRLQPGRYPLMVDVQIVGGYSSQAPRLREYTEADHRSDVAAAGRARSAALSADPDINPMLQAVGALRRSVLRQSQLWVGADSWRIWDAQEGVLPFARCWLGLTGEDLGPALRITEAVPLISRLGNTWEPGRMSYLAWMGLPFFAPDTRQAALEFAQANPRFRRPPDAVAALGALAVLPKSPPARDIPAAGLFPSHGVHAFRTPQRNLLALVQSGNAPLTRGAVAGHFGLHGFGRGWIEWREAADPSNGNLLAIGDLEPDQPATIVSQRYDADGSGSVVMDLDAFRKRRAPGARSETPATKPDPDGPRVRRFFTVDYSSGTGATLLIADRIERAAFLEKIWRFDVGNPGGFLNERAAGNGRGIRYREHDLVIAPGNARDGSGPPGTLLIRMEAGSALHWSERAGNKEGTRRILEARLDRTQTGIEREAKSARGPGDKQAAGIPGLDDLEHELGEQNRSTQRAAAPPLWVCTVLALQPGEPPEVRIENPGEAARVHVGNVSYQLGPAGWARSPAPEPR